MNAFRNFLYYFKYISFILFLYSAIVLYPGFISIKMVIICLVLLVIYSIITFIMFFTKSSGEQYSLLNNFVLCFLHVYTCFIAYKYDLIGDVFDVSTTSYFNLNFFVIALCLFTLTINKIILANTK